MKFGDLRFIDGQWSSLVLTAQFATESGRHEYTAGPHGYRVDSDEGWDAEEALLLAALPDGWTIGDFRIALYFWCKGRDMYERGQVS